jgi:predicted MFS family arabinose efflux permease
MLAGVVLSVAGIAVFGPGSIPAVVAGGILWGAFFGGLPSLIQTRLLHSASLRLRDTASAWLTLSFNLAIGGGALLGGVVLDVAGITVLPWVLVAGVALALLFVVLTDPIRLRSGSHDVRTR